MEKEDSCSHFLRGVQRAQTSCAATNPCSWGAGATTVTLQAETGILGREGLPTSPAWRTRGAWRCRCRASQRAGTAAPPLSLPSQGSAKSHAAPTARPTGSGPPRPGERAGAGAAPASGPIQAPRGRPRGSPAATCPTPPAPGPRQAVGTGPGAAHPPCRRPREPGKAPGGAGGKGGHAARGGEAGRSGGGRARPPRGLSPPHSPAGAAPARPRRRRRHPPPRCLGAGGSPGRLPPHLAAWAAAPGPAGGAGQRAAQSMGRVPGGAGGRPRQRREAAGTGQTLKRMSGASSGRGGSDGTAPGGGAGE